MNKKKIFKLAKGFRGRAKNCIRIARERVEKALQYSYRDRRTKKRDMRGLWIERINAGTRQHGVNYSTFIHGLMKENIQLNRKVLSEISMHEPYSFKSLVDISRNSFPGNKKVEVASKKVGLAVVFTIIQMICFHVLVDIVFCPIHLRRRAATAADSGLFAAKRKLKSRREGLLRDSGGMAKNCIRIARERVEKALQYSYRDRRTKKRDMRGLWTERINAGTRQHGVNYSTFIHGLMKENIQLNRDCNGDVQLGEERIDDSRRNFRAQWLHRAEISELGTGFDQKKQLDYDNNFESSSLGTDFSYSDSEESSDAEEEGDKDASEDDNFRVLDSCKRNPERTEVAQTYERDESEFRHPLVREACRLIDLRYRWDPKLEGDLKHVLRRLKPHQVCAVLHLQADERVALNFFMWAHRQWRYRHDPIVYYAMLQVLSKTKLCQGARRIFRFMHKRGIRRSPEAFGYLMISYSRAGEFRHAMQVLNLMQRAGVEPNLSICNTTIYVLVKGNKLDKALKFLERMQIVGIKPDVMSYNCLIKGYCDVKRVEDAIVLIEDMPGKGCPPDKVSYYTVLAFLCKEKRIDDVRKLMEKMVIESGLFPDMVTYNTIIHTLSKHGYGDDAKGFLREAEQKGFRIDKVGYTALITAFCHGGEMEKAREVVNEMFEKGCDPDVVTYTAVVDGFCRISKIDQAKKMMQLMYKHGCKPNTVSYTALLNGLCQSGKTVEAREMMNMSEEEWWTPNAITYSVVMHGFRKEGKLLEACDVVREMMSKGFFPTPVEINMLIQSLCREGRTEEAKKFMQECLSKGCAVNVVNFTTVIHGFCQNNDLDAALSLLDDMYLVNKHPDVFTYTMLVDALAKHDRFEEATELTMKMLKKGILPTPVTYRTIIHRYTQKGRTNDLLRLLDKMLPRQPYRNAYNQAIEKLCKLGYVDDAYKLLGEVLRTASTTDAHTCYVLMESFLNKGSPALSYKVACRMFKRNLLPDFKLCEKLCKRLMSEGKLEEADNLMLRFVERGHTSPSISES
ncbi:hypothetical protein V2J09_018645 [Rumex salicifolius]